MHQKNSPPRLAVTTVTEFLADREGLVGGARIRFHRALQEYGGFHEQKHGANLSAPILISSVFALVAGVSRPLIGWNDALALGLYVMFCAGLLLCWYRHGQDNIASRSDHETDWEAYCLFLRPIILNEHPGLLDRNRNNEEYPRAPLRLPPPPTFPSLFHERSPAFWWSAMTGLWIGMMLVLVLHRGTTVTHWIFQTSIMLGGIPVGVACGMWGRRIAYVIAKWHLRRFGP